MSNSLVIATVAIAVGSNEAKRLTTGKSLAIEPVLGGFILGLFLFAFTAINDKVAARFCILIIVTALLINGIAIFTVGTKLSTATLASGTSSTHGGSTGKGTSGGGGGGGGGGGV